MPSWPNKRLCQFPEPACAHCVDRTMRRHHAPRPRLTRLDTKSRPASISNAASITSKPPPSAMTGLVNQSTQSKDLSSQAGLPSVMEESPHLQDLELMMFWCTTTYRSMARDSVGECIWQTTIPQLSLRFPSLRHGLLALSALQLAGTSPTPERRWRYLVSARENQALALAGVRLDVTEDLTTAECNAHFALCCVLLVFSFAYCLIDDDDDEEEERPDVLDEFVEVFELTRWILSAMTLTVDRVAAGDLHTLIHSRQPRPTMPDMSRLVVLSLRRQNEVEAERNPAHEKGVYTQAIEHLTTSLEQLMNGGEPKDFAFCWAFRIPVRFQDLVRDRQPFALVVLAHYAVILHHLRNSWWMGDWGTRILQEIGDYLEPQWRELIGWPIDATGCVLG
ncbi:uncharacterized protein N7459_004538 [Penicillium hispanicum]|uniref:uncharacterized protein n=1 Tax=Penicillium hispanicum TaxID=1080232 RepID=UPI00254250F5|nr:uncharacterized protein N7459_004538 [Penicillium hispanicum]KAJ5584738.1 hypothetical protein N7459_004538 [Penicillium hispanicum]